MYPFGPCFSLEKCPGVGRQDHVVPLFLVFKEPPYCSPMWLHRFTFPQTAQEVPFSPHPLEHLLSVGFLMMAILTGVLRWLIAFICIFITVMALLNISSRASWRFACLLWRNVYLGLLLPAMLGSHPTPGDLGAEYKQARSLAVPWPRLVPDSWEDQVPKMQS